MARLAFCFLSNNYSNFTNMKKTFNYNLHHSSNNNVDSFTCNVLFNPPVYNTHYYDETVWNVEFKKYNHGKVIDMFAMRQDSIAMAGHSEFIFIGDDDLEFRTGATETINQCVDYMVKREDCGAIYLGGNFGGEGDKHGTEIYITNHGHLGTNRGILVRNRPIVLDNDLHAPGANFDFAVGFTALVQGYYIARRLHTPIDHHTKNVISLDNPNVFYNLQFLQEKGIMSKVNKYIGEWVDHSVWPDEIFTKYNFSAYRKDFKPAYSCEGKILCKP